jgi:ferredoxin-NADP reductase
VKQFNAQVIEVIPRTHNVTSFRLVAEEILDFQAGQFMQVTLAVNGCEQSKYFSFSSSPTEKKYFEFTKKMTGSEFSKALERLKSGDMLTVKMPMGKFVLDGTASKHAFLSGGIGITPIRSILKDASDRGLPLDAVLFYSNHSPEDVVFRSELEAMAAEKKFRLVLSLDTKDVCPADWKGRCGFIDAKMIREELPDYQERLFYVCGPPVMVQSMVSILEGQLKVPGERIRKENFAGY